MLRGRNKADRRPRPPARAHGARRMSTAVWVEQIDPNMVTDGTAFWYPDDGPVHVRADPPTRGIGPHGRVVFRTSDACSTVLTPAQARALMRALLSAADWAEGKT